MGAEAQQKLVTLHQGKITSEIMHKTYVTLAYFILSSQKTLYVNHVYYIYMQAYIIKYIIPHVVY